MVYRAGTLTLLNMNPLLVMCQLLRLLLRILLRGGDLKSCWSSARGQNYTSAAVRLLNATYHMALAQPIDSTNISTPAPGAKVNMTSSANATGIAGFEAAFMHSSVGNRKNNYDTGFVVADVYHIDAGNKLLKQGAWLCPGKHAGDGYNSGPNSVSAPWAWLLASGTALLGTAIALF